MKNLLTIAMLFISINILAQDYELYKCTQASVRNVESDKWKTSETSILIRLNVKENMVEFGNKSNTIIYLTGVISKETKMDDEGDEYIKIIFKAYDETGKRCNFISYDYTELPARNFLISYSDYEFHYSCVFISTKKETDEKNNQIL